VEEKQSKGRAVPAFSFFVKRKGLPNIALQIALSRKKQAEKIYCGLNISVTDGLIPSKNSGHWEHHKSTFSDILDGFNRSVDVIDHPCRLLW
jgi:hypothetical protein